MTVIDVLVRIVTAIALAVVTTSISLRLLGMRRGWGRALVSGLLGWGIAVFLALGLASWDWGADGLVVHMLAIGVPATMAVAVALDLLARPGSLATGEHAGLVTAARPLRALRMRVSVLRRYHELLRLARNQGFGPFGASGRAEHSADSVGVRLRRVLEQAGGVYVKLGQIAATRVDLLPADVCSALAELQHRVAPEPFERIEPVLEHELGAPVDAVFSEFDWEPVAAASIGQTYLARLRTGERVVVKVQRPGVDDVIRRDVAALSLLAGVAQRRTAVGLGIRSGDMLDQFAQGLYAELDFRKEVDAMEEMASLLSDCASVRVPKAFRELCTRRLIVQEYFDGVTLTDLARASHTEIDRRAVARRLLQSMLEQVMRVGYFHADPHPGNVFVFGDGAIGLIDFGAVGRLDPVQQHAVVDMFAALVQRDVALLRDAIERVADVSEAVSPDRLERALARLLAENLRPSGAIEGTALQDLVRLLSEFGVRLPRDLVVLSRALVTLEGTLRVVSPGLSMVEEVSQMAMSSTPEVLDRDAMIHDELVAALPRLRRIPDRLDRILTLTSRGDLRLRTVVDEDSQRIVRTLANRALLFAIGAVFLVAGTMLLVAREQGPIVASRTGLFEVLGYGGLLAAVVLLLRVAAAVVRDGTT